MEEIEVPTEHLHEAIGERVEEARERKEKNGTMGIAISTALMAVFAALSSLIAGHHADEALLEQIQASDQWAYYQAKGIKAEIQSLGNRPDREAVQAAYRKDQANIKKEAEQEAASSRQHLERHAVLARAVTLFQISIAISAIAILTRKRMLWFAGLAISCAGLYFFISGLC